MRADSSPIVIPLPHWLCDGGLPSDPEAVCTVASYLGGWVLVILLFGGLAAALALYTKAHESWCRLLEKDPERWDWVRPSADARSAKCPSCAASELEGRGDDWARKLRCKRCGWEDWLDDGLLRRLNR